MHAWKIYKKLTVFRIVMVVVSFEKENIADIVRDFTPKRGVLKTKMYCFQIWFWKIEWR